MMIKIANVMRRLRKDEKGFTLIELMVVIAVLGILAALIIPQFANVNTKAYDGNAKASASAVASAAAMFYAEKQTDPTSTDDLSVYMGNIDAIATDYTITFAGGAVTVVGADAAPNNIPASITATASYR